MEIVAKYRIPAGFLRREDLGIVLNKQLHGLGQDELLATVLELSRQGLVAYTTRQDETERQFPNMDQIRDAVAEESRFGRGKTFLCLTAEGGRVWEAFAAPEWDEFIDEGSLYDESLGREVTELICTNRERLDRYLKCAHPSLSQIDPSLVWRDVLEPWEATYWKVLPKGHRVRFVDPDTGTEDQILPPQFVFPPRWYRWD